MINKLGLIGCGLIGGSFALALKRAGLVNHVAGYSRSQSSAERALALGVIDEVAHTAVEAVAGADVVLLAVPVAATESTLLDIRDHITPHMLVMDVGSTKQDVVEVARRVLQERVSNFVPAHPIAGKEVAGVEHADALLFQNRQTMLTPLVQNKTHHLTRATTLWQAVGSKVHTLSPQAHDATFAAVSHLPHLLAFAAMQALIEQPAGEEYLDMAGPGFRDFSRIAAGDPQVWRDIFLSNREQLLAQAALFRNCLQQLEQCIATGDADALQAHIASASEARLAWQNKLCTAPNS